jgi:hypothetical protein
MKIMKKQTCCKTTLFIAISLFITTFNAMSEGFLMKDLKWIEKLKVPNVQDIDVMKMDSNVLIYQSRVMRNQDLYSSVIGGVEKNYIYRVDLKTKQAINKEISLKDGGKRRAVEKILYMNNTIHVISSFTNDEQKKYFIFDETVKSDNLELNNDAKKICEVDYGQIEGASKNSIETSISLNKSKLLITSALAGKGMSQYFIHIYDSQLNEKANYTIKKTNSDTYVIRVKNDNDDNLYVMESNKAKKDEPRKYAIYYYSKDHTAPKQQALMLENKAISFDLSVNRNNDLICAGLFFKNGQASASGAFSYVFPAGLSAEGKLNLLPFSNEFLTRGLDENETAKVEKALKNNEEFNDKCSYLLDTMHIQQNGDFMFTTEKTKTERRALTSYVNNSYSSSNESFYYTFGDIYAFSCNVDGSFKWHQKIAKKTVLADDNSFAGHYLTHYDSNNNMNLIYGSFLSTKLLGVREGFGKDPKTIMTTFDANGNKTEKVLFTEKALVQTFMPVYSKSWDNNNLIITRINHGFVATSSTYSIAQITLK